jgi:molybdopterin-guanine dinucleotide biosynthesis protein A
MRADPALRRSDITGIVLAGGRGSRMGGVEKGLQWYAGKPLALHAIERLRPQVGPLLISANRHADLYADLGAPVVADAADGHAGPLAGFLAGLNSCETPYLATVPCDAPRFPTDLVAKLAQALVAGDADLAIAAAPGPGGKLRPQPVFCLMRASLRGKLAAFLARGEGKVGLWAALQRCAAVNFDDAEAFVNINTGQDLDRLQRQPVGPD